MVKGHRNAKYATLYISWSNYPIEKNPTTKPGSCLSVVNDVIPLSQAYYPRNQGLRPRQLVWRCHQLLSGFLAKGHLPECHVCQVTMRVIMRRYRELCTDLLVFTLRLRKTSARRPSMKALLPVIASNGVSYLRMTSVRSHSTSGREKEGMKERTVSRKLSQAARLL